MKISTKGRYGLTIMIELAKKYGEGPVSLKSIAQANDLSEHYLEQLIAPLRNAGLVRSIRGAYGGYVLADEPGNITSGDVIRVLEGPITPVEGIEDEIEGEMLKATVVINNGTENQITKEYILKHCAKKLSLYKIPKVYELKRDLTISATGKKVKKG